MIYETPDYTRVCGYCELPVSDPTTINEIAFHKSCLSIMADEMKREEEWKSMSEEERQASYEKLDAKTTYYNGGIPL